MACLQRMQWLEYPYHFLLYYIQWTDTSTISLWAYPFQCYGVQLFASVDCIWGCTQFWYVYQLLVSFNRQINFSVTPSSTIHSDVYLSDRVTLY